MTAMDSGGPATRLIDGRFELLQRLGGGGMGLVWRAWDNALHREVALKEVRPPDPSMAAAQPAAAWQMRERVLREARALARLQHPNIAVIHHIVDSAEYPHPWLVMELVSGGSLEDRLAHGALTVPEAARIGRGVLSALQAAHTAGIQHRDVKPGNVLLRGDGTPVLTDFGIAAMQGATTLTATNAVIGSPEYMAPERIRGEEGNPASDLWSLGMMLYVAVEGHHPLRRPTALATLAAALNEPLPPPVHAGRLGPALSAVLARDPVARPDAVQLDRLLAAAELPQDVAHTKAQLTAPVAAPADWTLGLDDSDLGPSRTEPAGWRSPPDRLPHAVPSSHSRRTGLAVAALVAALALGGTLAWTLGSGSGAHAGSLGGRRHAPAAAARNSAAARSSAVSSPAPHGPGSSAGPSVTSSNLLTPAAVRRMVAAIRRRMAGARVFQLVVYPDYAMAQVPTAADPTLYDEIEYRDGAITRSPGGTATSGQQTVDLRSFNWNVLPGLLRKARETLNVPHPTSRYIIIGPDIFNGTPNIRVYLADAYGGGYLSASPDGTVERTYPRGS
jgi:serine/threonine protein kinase